MEKQFDINALAQLLNKSFPDLVKLSEDRSAIIVMERIKLTKEGVVEGTGPAADKVRTIYEEFMGKLQQHESQMPNDGFLPNTRPNTDERFRCQHCGLKLAGRVYRRNIAGSVLLFCCKQCADYHETESARMQNKLI